MLHFSCYTKLIKHFPLIYSETGAWAVTINCEIHSTSIFFIELLMFLHKEIICLFG